MKWMTKQRTLKKITLFFHTVKYLRRSQIWYRLYYRLRKLRLRPMTNLERRHWKAAWDAPAKRSERSILSTDRVFFLGELGELATQASWNCKEKDKLWLYNLHYLDELNSIYGPSNTLMLNEFIEKWVRDNPPVLGNGWEPYPLSLRLVNLIKWFSSEHTEISSRLLGSLGEQAQALVKQLEYHIRANHLFANGKALVFVGAYFRHNEAAIWLKKGLQILDSEIKEQFLLDGGHFELSPMYHASLLWDLCDLVNLANKANIASLTQRKAEWIKLIIKAYKWLNLMCHPDGDLSFFNDAAFGIAPTPSLIRSYMTQLGITPDLEINKDFSLSRLKDSGYYIVHLGASSKAIVDVGKIGVDYQPGHAHADTLSFELSVYNQRIFVNSGTSLYGANQARELQRSTKVHNTVTIDNENSSEVWGGFRVARRAYPRELMVQEKADCIKISCNHDGYLRLAGRNLHYRQWIFLPNKLSIEDRITGSYTTAEARYYFHPDLKPRKLRHDTIECTFGEGKVVWIGIKNALELVLEPSTWHPFFGSSRANCCLVAKIKDNHLLTEIEW